MISKQKKKRTSKNPLQYRSRAQLLMYLQSIYLPAPIYSSAFIYLPYLSPARPPFSSFFLSGSAHPLTLVYRIFYLPTL